jgi:Short C-terminal domain
MVSDQRSDIYVVRLEFALTDSETVLRIMDGRHARVMGPPVLTSERIHFRSRRRTGPTSACRWRRSVPSRPTPAGAPVQFRVITPYGSLTVDQILGRQREMLAADAQVTIRGEPLPERDPLRLLAKLRALRESGAISAAEFEIRKSAIWREI